MDELILALDFGGTKLSAATVLRADLATDEPTWLRLARVASPVGASAETDIRLMLKLAQRVVNGSEISAVGVSFGGPADFKTGRVIRSDHVPGWENVALQAQLETHFGVPVRLDNDANIAALGEHRFGAGRGANHLLYITVSTGVGGGWILNGKPWRGWHRMAGEIGHVVVAPDGPRCLCGKHGCVERLASGPYMAADAAERLMSDPAAGPILRKVAGNSAVTSVHVAQAAALGDGLAVEVLTRGAWALGTAIGNVTNLMDIERVVLGGGVTKSGELWWQTVRNSAEATALPDVANIAANIVPARFQDDAPLWGAVALVADLA